MYSPGLMYKEHDHHLAAIIWPSVPFILFPLLKGAISLNITQAMVGS